MRGLLRGRLLEPVLLLLRQGPTPEKLACRLGERFVGAPPMPLSVERLVALVRALYLGLLLLRYAGKRLAPAAGAVV